MVGYVDVDYVGDHDKRRSMTGYVFSMADVQLVGRPHYSIQWYNLLQRQSTWQHQKALKRQCS